MAKLYQDITEDLAEFIRAQPMFFVASAPLDASGHVNLSPKGLDSFRVLSPNRVAYCDLTGSGNETAAHLAENGRITFMFCSFEGPPRILRLFGKGKVVLPNMPEWDDYAANFQLYPGLRQIIVAEISRVQTSCGFGVPLMNYEGQRDAAIRWATAKGESGLAEYRATKNGASIDGLPAPLAE